MIAVDWFESNKANGCVVHQPKKINEVQPLSFYFYLCHARW